MAESLPIPPSVDAITPEWLTDVLRASGALPAGQVSDIDVAVIGEGVGFVGALARIGIEYKGAPDAAPASLIAKLPGTDPGSRALGVMYGLYEREVRFYQQMAPHAGIAVPNCYHADYDPSGAAVLLLEELTGGRFGDQLAGSTPEEASLAVRHLARFHAKWWNSPRIAEFPWLVPGEILLGGPLQMMYDASVQPCLARFGHLFPEQITAMLPGLGKRTLKAMETFFAGPRTVCQGDYRPDNLFYGAPGTGRELISLDWQIPNYSPPITDIAYIIAGSLGIEDRRKHDHELLAEYHAGLCEGGVSGYSYEQLVTDYRSYFAGILATGVVLGASIPDGNERGKAMLDVTFRRFIAAIEDLDALSLLPEI